MAQGVFITGTDTGCGKTEITLGLMQRLQQAGQVVLGMKPIASGAVRNPARTAQRGCPAHSAPGQPGGFL